MLAGEGLLKQLDCARDATPNALRCVNLPRKITRAQQQTAQILSLIWGRFRRLAAVAASKMEVPADCIKHETVTVAFA